MQWKYINVYRPNESHMSSYMYIPTAEMENSVPPSKMNGHLKRKQRPSASTLVFKGGTKKV